MKKAGSDAGLFCCSASEWIAAPPAYQQRDFFCVAIQSASIRWSLDSGFVASETAPMQIHCHALKTMQCAAPAVFDLMVDPVRFTPLFSGYGLIPAIRSISLDGPLAVGAIRHLVNADDSTLTEVVTALDRPSRHAYTLGGFRPPFSWLVTHGCADWSVSADGPTSHVRWDYIFTLASSWTIPVAPVVLQFLMTRAMRRCLDNMACVLATKVAEPGTAASGNTL